LALAACGGSSAAPAAAGAASTPIRIGVINPLTGPLANLGKDFSDGFNLYLASIHNAIAGRPVEPMFADSEGKADTGLTKAKQLVESDHVQLLTGITATPVCYAVDTYVKQAHVPLVLSANCAAEKLMTDSKFASPYVVRFAHNATLLADPAADWMYQQSYRKVILMAADFGGGLESADAFASAFIQRGGSIIQELYPAQGTSDYGPFLAKLDPSADALYGFMPGIDSLRFLQQYGNYAGQSKLQLVDATGSMTVGPNLGDLKGTAVGVVGINVYSPAIDTPMNKQFLQAFEAKYPGRYVSGDVARGYSAAQILAAALEKVNGRAEDNQPLMQALYSLNVDTVKGPTHLDKNHDDVENIYVFRVVKQGERYGHELLQTYQNVSRDWDRGESEVDRFPWGEMKGKWVGMTSAQLQRIEAPTS